MGTKGPFPEDHTAYRILKGKTLGKRPLGRKRRRREHNIKTDLSEKDCKDRVGYNWLMFVTNVWLYY
jgi:hypothetical protein